MLARLLSLALLLSLAGNGVTAALYYRAKAETKTLVAEAAAAENEKWADVAAKQQLAYEDQITELRRRLELSDQVTRDARARAENAEANLRSFEAAQAAAAAVDPSYKTWAETELPAGVAERLRALQ